MAAVSKKRQDELFARDFRFKLLQINSKIFQGFDLLNKLVKSRCTVSEWTSYLRIKTQNETRRSLSS